MTLDLSPVADLGPALFGFLAAAVGVLLAVGWLRRVVDDL